MPTPVRLPNLGAEASEARLANWIRAIGDTVEAGDPLAEIETEKATVDLEAPVSGRLSQIMVQAGEDAPVGSIVAMIEEG